MNRIEETELILGPEQRLYHINLKNDDIADNVIIVGDQNRVAQISSCFSSIDFKTSHREFITHTGCYNGKRITVLSTGIGTDNIDIVMNELDAAVNIDPLTRTIKDQKRKLNVIRLGTSGALQSDVAVNDLVVSSHGIGFDGLLNFYDSWSEDNEDDISDALIEHVNWDDKLPFPYCFSSDMDLLRVFSEGNHVGMTVTAPGFYGPQGRELRLKAKMKNLNDLLSSFSHRGKKITNFEMETSALYGLGKMLGHRCLTVCVIIANRVRKEFTTDYSGSVNKLIEACLNRFTEIK